MRHQLLGGLIVLFVFPSLAISQSHRSTKSLSTEPTVADIQRWNREISDPDEEVRGLACEALGKLRDRKIADNLVALLEDVSPFVRVNAINALLLQGDQEFKYDIDLLKKDSDANVQAAAVRASIIWQAMWFLESVYAPQLKGWAALELARVGAGEHANLIAAELADPIDPTYPHEGISALGQLGAKEYAPGIAEFLFDRKPEVRAAAALALGQLGAREYSTLLLDKAFNDTEPVARNAVYALWLLRTRKSKLEERAANKEYGDLYPEHWNLIRWAVEHWDDPRGEESVKPNQSFEGVQSFLNQLESKLNVQQSE